MKPFKGRSGEAGKGYGELKKPKDPGPLPRPRGLFFRREWPVCPCNAKTF